MYLKVSVKVFSNILNFNSYRLQILCLFFFLNNNPVNGSTDGPSSEFSRYSIVRPTLHDVRTKRELSTTRHTDGIHHQEVTLKVALDGEDHIIDLQLNKDLITENHVIKYQKDGQDVIHKPGKKELDICQYKGSIRDRPGSWAAVSTCHGVRGIIYDGVTAYSIEPTEGGLMSFHQRFQRSIHRRDFQSSHYDIYGDVTTNKIIHKVRKSDIHNKQSQSQIITHVREPYNSNDMSRYVELVLVVDNNMYRETYQRNMRKLHERMKDYVNIVNSMYAPLNIFIALKAVVVWTEANEITINRNSSLTLDNFLSYRINKLNLTISNDNAQLITRQIFDYGVVGKAYTATMCSPGSAAIVLEDSEIPGVVAAAMAHEMGHNFGMHHDDMSACTCPDEQCIMNDETTKLIPVHWSSCSHNALVLSFSKGLDYCLRNKPKFLFGSPTCGNGFVEAGEQCDCGSGDTGVECERCCDRNTCMLRNNATCATGHCCDMQTCSYKPKSTMCTSADKPCDLPEYCSGHSEYCPEDVFKMDSTPCGNNETYCYKGECRSHTSQCQLLWGQAGKMSDEVCYKFSGCKNNLRNKCYMKDVICGRLQCSTYDDELNFINARLQSSNVVNKNGDVVPCRAAIIEMGSGIVDPGLVPDGAKCGDNKMCLHQRCISIEHVRAQIARKPNSVCPSYCSGHGVCNSEGHCHCEVGFSPPLCDSPGPGGSLDSGPASAVSDSTDYSDNENNYLIYIYIFFGVLVCIVLVIFLICLICYLRRRRQTKKSFDSGLVTSVTEDTEPKCDENEYIAQTKFNGTKYSYDIEDKNFTDDERPENHIYAYPDRNKTKLEKKLQIQRDIDMYLERIKNQLHTIPQMNK